MAVLRGVRFLIAGLVLVSAGCVSRVFAQVQAPTQGEKTSRLVGYFPQWGLYNDPPYTVKSLVESHGAQRLDQINYAQGFVTGGRCSVADPAADLGHTFLAAESVSGVGDRPEQPLRGNFNQLLELKRRYPGIKILISLEGRASDFEADASETQRRAFVSSCVNLFLAGHVGPGVELGRLFDGVDVDWEYPGQEHADDLVKLLSEFRQQMTALHPGYLLTIAVGPHPRMAGGDDLSAVSALVDEIGVMTYDMAGPWTPRTGFHSALFGREAVPGVPAYGTAAGAISRFVAAGVPPGKLLLGVPFYGYGWKDVPDENNGLFEEGAGIRGDRPYSEISRYVAGSTQFRDEVSQAPWLFDGDAFWTYDDPTSIHFKAEYVKSQHLGGLMAWELGEDTPGGALLQSASDGLRAPAKATGITPVAAVPPAAGSHGTP